MGADIHGVLQVKWNHKEEWETEDYIESERHYLTFSALAGVRNYMDIRPISEPRDLPDGFKVDKSNSHDWRDWRGEQSEWLGDHSHSWLTLDEILEWDGWDQELKFQNDSGTLREYCNLFLAWAEYKKLKHSFPGNIRIVFGFDS